MIQHVVFEKFKKVDFELSTTIFARLEHGIMWQEPGQFSRSNSKGLSKGVKTNDEKKSF